MSMFFLLLTPTPQSPDEKHIGGRRDTSLPTVVC
jgi:hypothetical protein